MLDTIPNGALWLPGQGQTSTSERQAAKAVEEYDPDLILGQRQDSGEWVVFLKNGPNGGEPFPVLGLGTTLLAPEEIKKRLYNADVRKHGVKIFNDIQRRNDAKLEAARSAASEASGVVAESMDWGFRKMGVHPFPRIFIPKGV